MTRWIGLAVVLIGVSAVLVLGGCGTKTVTVTVTSTATVTAAPEMAASDAAAPESSSGSEAGAAAVGDTLTLTSENNSDGQIKVTVIKTGKAPAETDWHGPLFGVYMTVANVGSTRFDGSPSAASTIIDTQDQSHGGSGFFQGADGDYLDGQLGDVDIAPGDKRTGWVYFELKGLTPRLLQSSAASSADGGFETGEWSLK